MRSLEEARIIAVTAPILVLAFFLGMMLVISAHECVCWQRRFEALRNAVVSQGGRVTFLSDDQCELRLPGDKDCEPFTVETDAEGGFRVRERGEDE